MKGMMMRRRLLTSVVVARNRALETGQNPEYQAQHSEGEEENTLTGET